MDMALFTAAVEAQFLMGHRVPTTHVDAGRTQLVTWSWQESEVRQALHVPLDDLWEQRVLALEGAGLVCVSLLGPEPGSEDEPREDWADVSLFPQGVLTMATWYGRPYVRQAESPAVLAHWTLVQAESAARLQQPHDEARWAREWPERYLSWVAKMAQRDGEEPYDDHG